MSDVVDTQPDEPIEITPEIEEKIAELDLPPETPEDDQARIAATHLLVEAEREWRSE